MLFRSQRPHPLVAQAADVHRIARGKVYDAFQYAARAGGVGAVAHRFIGGALDRRAARGALLGHVEGAFGLECAMDALARELNVDYATAMRDMARARGFSEEAETQGAHRAGGIGVPQKPRQPVEWSLTTSRPALSRRR